MIKAENMINSKRIGKIECTLEVIEEIELRQSLFEKFIPIKSNIDYNDVITYEGISDDFDEIKDSNDIPIYEIIFMKQKSGKTSCSLAKK